MVGSLVEHLMLFISILFNLEQNFCWPQPDYTLQLQFGLTINILLTWNLQPWILDIFPANKIEGNLIVQSLKAFSETTKFRSVALKAEIMANSELAFQNCTNMYRFFCYGHKRLIGQHLNGRVWSMGHTAWPPSHTLLDQKPQIFILRSNQKGIFIPAVVHRTKVSITF